MMTAPHPTLRLLSKLGQQIWLDQLNRDWLRDGTLRRWLTLGVSGVTTNPAIFAHALATCSSYREEIASLNKKGVPAEDALETIVAADVLTACQQLRPLWEESGGQSGYVSIEVSPTLANDTEGTIAAARRLRQRIPEPNLLIKIPATAAGVAALTPLVAEGVGTNMTLIFSHAQWQAVLTAYEAGRVAAAVARQTPGYCVASIFLSRIDSVIDPLLAERAPDHPDWQGKSAIALAKGIAADYQTLREQSPGFAQAPQRLLWASTSTKNPAYSDLLYVEPLVGAETIATLPLATLEALLDHGTVAKATLLTGIDEARAHLARLADLGIDLDAVGNELQRVGLAAFAQAHAHLLRLFSSGDPRAE